MCSTDNNHEFSDVAIGTVFTCRGVTYRKLDDDKAALVDASPSDTVHIFYPEESIVPVDED